MKAILSRKRNGNDYNLNPWSPGCNGETYRFPKHVNKQKKKGGDNGELFTIACNQKKKGKKETVVGSNVPVQMSSTQENQIL